MSNVYTPQFNHLLGQVTLGAPTSGGTNRAASTGTPKAVIQGRLFDVSVNGAGAVDTKDSANDEAAPILGQGENFIVVHTVGFDEGTATGNPKIRYRTLFGAKGDLTSHGPMPVHVGTRDVPYAAELFQNNGTTDFQYGVTNFPASFGAAGVQRKVVELAHMPVNVPWEALGQS